MYLIKVELDRRDARGLLADCQQMHRFITGFFGTDRQRGQILYRTNLVQNTLCIYLYGAGPAKYIPKNCRCQQRDITSWLNALEAGQIWNFDLIASPSKKVAVEGKKNSQRRILRDPEARQAWLNRKAEQNGFVVLQAREQEQVHVSGKHNGDQGGAMCHNAYHYQGVLLIVDVEAFRKAIQSGIGPGKAYGFGMLLLR